MTDLPEKASLPELQAYAKLALSGRGFDDETIPEKFMLLMEECGELAKAVRKGATSVKTDAASKTYDVGAEAADVLMYLLDIANRLGIDLESAFRAKEEENRKRTWSA